MQPVGRGSAATSYKPFLHHVSKRGGERRRAIELKTSRRMPKVLTVQQVQSILDSYEHLRDRLLFALMLDTGVRVGEAVGLHHEDFAIAEKTVTGHSIRTTCCSAGTTPAPAPRVVMAVVRLVKKRGVVSLLDLSEHQWRELAGAPAVESIRFLCDARQLPGTAASYVGGTPPIPRQDDRRLAEYVMTQIEAPANLDR